MLNLFGEEYSVRERRPRPRRFRAPSIFRSELQPELPLRWVAKPLLPDLDLCALARTGDREAEALMVERHSELASLKAKDARIHGLEEGDLVALALAAILKAVRSYRDKRIPFDRYARYLIAQAMVSASRRQRRVVAEFAAAVPEDYIDLDDILDDSGASPYRGLIFRSDLSTLAALLTEEEKHILFMKLQEHTDAEIAVRLGCSEATIWRRMKKIREKAEPLMLGRN